MSTAIILFWIIGLLLVSLITFSFLYLLKWLGTLPGDWQALKQNEWIILPFATLLIFAVGVALLIQFNQLWFGVW